MLFKYDLLPRIVTADATTDRDRMLSLFQQSGALGKQLGESNSSSLSVIIRFPEPRTYKRLSFICNILPLEIVFSPDTSLWRSFRNQMTNFNRSAVEPSCTRYSS